VIVMLRTDYALYVSNASSEAGSPKASNGEPLGISIVGFYYRL